MAKKKAKSAEKASPKKSLQGAGGSDNKSPANAGGSTNDVPRENVGAAVQAAVSFENASIVTAEATDDTRRFFRVSWR